jgi:hypothetical protein
LINPTLNSKLQIFHSPLDAFIHSLSFLFTHASPQVTSATILKCLAKLLQAAHVEENPDTQSIVKYLFQYVKQSGNRCIIYPEEITADAPTADRKRRDLIDLIMASQPVLHDNASQLGCPLTSEAQAGLQEKCSTLGYCVEKSLREKDYELAVRNMDLLNTLNTALCLPDVSAVFEQAMGDVRSHLAAVSEDARKHLHKLNDLEALNRALNSLNASCALQAYVDAEAMYNALTTDLNKQANALTEQITGRVAPDYPADVDALDTLQNIQSNLEVHLLDNYYSMAQSAVQARVEEQNKICSSVLCSFKMAIENGKYPAAGEVGGHVDQCTDRQNTQKNKKGKMGKKGSLGASQPLASGTAGADHSETGHSAESLDDVHVDTAQGIAAPPAADLNHTTVVGCVMFEDLFTSMNGLGFVECLCEHFPVEQRGYYSQHCQVLTELIQLLECFILGDKGLLSRIRRLTASEQDCRVLGTLHTLLRNCYNNGANDHLDGTLQRLDETVINRTLDALTAHTNDIEELACRQDYEYIPVILDVIGHISLEGESLEKFKGTYLTHRTAMLRRNLTALRDNIEKSITSLSSREVLEVADITELVSLFQIEKHRL